jgi:hypothetical protein
MGKAQRMTYEHGATYAGAIVKSVSVENMVNQRAAVVERIDRALTLLTEARELAIAAGLGFPRLKIDENKYGCYSMVDPEHRKTVDESMRKIVDIGGWQHLMSESGLRTFMDAKAREAWDKQVHEGNVPELTLENVVATFQSLHASRGDMFERGVIECFKALSWHYRTNRPFKFGKRCIIRYIRGQITAREGGGGTALAYVNYQNVNKLDDLTRVFSVLDGKAEPDHRQGWYSLLGKVNKTTDPDAENEYMRVKCFRNGNGHITFTRPDLVDQLNAIVARHYPGALPHDRHSA